MKYNHEHSKPYAWFYRHSTIIFSSEFISEFSLIYVSYRKTSNISRTLVGNKIVDNYIFILNLTPGFNGLGRYNCKARQETFKLGDLVRFILEGLR